MREYLDSFYAPQGGVEFEYLHDQDYVLVECDDCETVFQREIPGDALMKRLYGQWIDPGKSFALYERTRGVPYFSALSAEILGLIGFFDRPPMDLTFLDYSMGWGHWCRIAQSFGCTVHGMEFSQARIDYRQGNGSHRC